MLKDKQEHENSYSINYELISNPNIRKALFKAGDDFSSYLKNLAIRSFNNPTEKKNEYK